MVVVPKGEPWLGREMASAQEAERFWLPAAAATFAEERHPSEILASRSAPGHRVGELYQDMLEKDADLASFASKRADAVVSLPRSIIPADSTPIAAEVALFVQQALAKIPQHGDALRHQTHAMESKGLGVVELIWAEQTRGPLAGAWTIVDAIDRPMWRFTFRRGERGTIYVRQPGRAEPLLAPPGKFVALTSGTKDSPWGKGLLDSAYWYWFLKIHGWKYWAVFVEKWSSPTAVGKYRHCADERANLDAQARLLEAISAIQQEQGIVIPQGLAVELLEAQRSGSVSYESFVEACTRAMARLYLGEVDTSGAGAGPGSFAKAVVSDDVRAEKTKADAHRLASGWSDTIIRWLVEVNFGPDAPAPKLDIAAIDAEDREQRREGVASVLEAGEPVPRAYFYMTMQVPLPRDGEEVIVRKKTPAPPVPAPPAELPEEDDDPDLADRGRTHRLAAGGELELEGIGAEVEERDRDFEALAIDFAGETVAYYEVHYARVLELWDAGEVRNGTLLRRLVEGLDPVRQAEAIQTAAIHGGGLALLHLRDELGIGNLRLADAGSPRERRTPATAVEHWASVLQISKAVLQALSDAAKRLAFAVAGVRDAALLADLYRLQGRAIATGMSRADFKRELDELYARHGVTSTSKWHAELIYANGVRQAAGVVRWQQTVGNPAVHALIPYLYFWTLDDRKVRDRENHNHRAVHGYIAAIGHEFWRTWWFPAGHNCRCGIGTIARPEARRRGLTGAEPVGPWPIDPRSGAKALPDPGFRGVPSLGAVALQQELRAEDLLVDARAAGSSDLVAALEALFAALGLVLPSTGADLASLLRQEVA